jgi:hypothetical protein
MALGSGTVFELVPVTESKLVSDTNSNSVTGTELVFVRVTNLLTNLQFSEILRVRAVIFISHLRYDILD